MGKEKIRHKSGRAVGITGCPVKWACIYKNISLPRMGVDDSAVQWWW